MADYNIQMSILNSSGSYDNLNPVTLLANVSDWADYIYSKTELPSIIVEQVSGLSYSKCRIGSYIGTQALASDINGSFNSTTINYIEVGFTVKFLIIQGNIADGFGWESDLKNALVLNFPYKPIPTDQGGQPGSVTVLNTSFGVRNVTYNTSNGNNRTRTALNRTGTTYYYIAMG